MKIFFCLFFLFILPLNAQENIKIKFPLKFHGIWDVSQNSCKQRFSDAKLVISAYLIKYWESSGYITEVTSFKSNKLKVIMAMNGEGENWITNSIYSVSETSLTEYFSDGNSFTRIRCNDNVSNSIKL